VPAHDRRERVLRDRGETAGGGSVREEVVEQALVGVLAGREPALSTRPRYCNSPAALKPKRSGVQTAP